MAKDTISISYGQSSPIAKKSEVYFYNQIPDLQAFFYSVKPANRRFFITDAKVASLECMQKFTAMFNDDKYENDCLIMLGSGEPYKNIDTVLTIVKKAMEFGFSKNDTFIGIGGGVVCDLTAFAASIYMRGVSVQLVPTTLLAMVDASIGGKTSCDVGSIKNVIGTFYPADQIHIFTDFAQHTSLQQYKSGLAEAFKTAFIKDAPLLDDFKTKSEKILDRDPALIDKIVRHCVKAKADIVKQDFTDNKGIRAILDLGHTFGYALETTVGLGAITEGEAVAWGISRALKLSWNKGYCNEAFYNEIIQALELYGWETTPVPSLVIGGGVGERVLSIMHKDKKVLNDKIQLIIPKAVEDIVMEPVEDSEVLAVLK